jgi:glycosyltransferase involved in cell wall biosynthesis
VIKRFSIFGPSVGAGLGKNVFGKDVANHSLFRSLLLYGGLEQLDILNPNAVKPEQILASFIGNQTTHTKIRSYSLLDASAAKASGTLMRGTADIINLAWDRRAQGTALDYSLIGLIHTIAPHSIREYIAQTLVAPVMPWDALICTSPSIQTAMKNMFDEWRDYLGARFSGGATSAPLLPLIPLGVEASDFPSAMQNQQGRASLRAELCVGSEDMLVLWVGRLSFFEKAFPQPMMLALEAAAKLSGKRVHFAMAGWFPSEDTDEKMYRQAANVHAPSVAFHIIDGNDKPKLRDAWAGADVFISLVDNIQETFGITPLEAMASGLPVVVSEIGLSRCHCFCNSKVGE